MDKRIKGFAQSLRAHHHTISRRLLDDVAEHYLDVHDQQEPADSHMLDATTAHLEASRADSTVLDRACGATVDEKIYLAKAPNVKTSIKRLAKLLKQAIESAAPDYVVVSRPLASVISAFDGSRNRIQIVYEHEDPSKRASEQPEANDAFDRVVFVALTDVTPMQAYKLKRHLHKELRTYGDSYYCSLIPTIITGKPGHDVIHLGTEPIYDLSHHRFHRDKSVLSASLDDPATLPDQPLTIELERWGRNVTNRQVGFASSGGGACAFRTIAVLDELRDHGVPIDVFAGLSGGSLVGAYLAGDEKGGLHKLLNRGKTFASMLPMAMLTTEPIQAMVDKDVAYQRVGQTSLRYFVVTTEMRNHIPPGAEVVKQGTLGQAVRASSALPAGFAPTNFDGRRFTDGMASAIVPTHVVVDHGADVVMACNCIPGPNQTNPFADYWWGRLAYETVLGRFIDLWTWTNFLTQRASTEYGRGCDVYFQFNPENISSMEIVKWADSWDIYRKAQCESEQITAAVEKLKQAWKGMH